MIIDGGWLHFGYKKCDNHDNYDKSSLISVEKSLKNGTNDNDENPASIREGGRTVGSGRVASIIE